MPPKNVRLFRPSLLCLEDRTTPSAGMLDPTFGVGGKVTTNASYSGQGRAVALDHFGRIVMAGYRDTGFDSDYMVTRYLANGALDTSFGGTGIVTISFGASTYDYGRAVTIDSQNRIIVAGSAIFGNPEYFGVVRLTASGALDTSFDVDGRQTISFGRPNNSAFGVAVDSFDRIVIAGNTGGDGNNTDMAVARLTVSGALDSDFNGSGKWTLDFNTLNDSAFCVTVDSINRVVIAGAAEPGSTQLLAVVRLTAIGELDSTFNGDGKETFAFNGSTDNEALGVAIDRLDRIVVAGAAYTNSMQQDAFAVARLLPNGVLDTTFDGDGKQTIDFSPADEAATGVSVDSLNRIVVAGNFYNGTGNDFAVIRLTNAGALDSSFDADGKQTIDFNGGDDVGWDVMIDSASRVLVGGTKFDRGGNQDYFALARLKGDITTAAARVNDGSFQRSRVTSLSIYFTSQVSFTGSPDQAFTLVRTGGGAVSFITTVSVQTGLTVVTLDQFTGAETEFGSLADGRYTLTVLASHIGVAGGAFDGDNDDVPGGDFVFGSAQGCFRLFGDVNGDQTVNGFDLGFFRSAFGTQTGDPNYLSYLDLNGDGVINGFDFGQFRTRFGTVLP
jgi:uncharacterized delta-60 repeat protein